MNRWTRREFIRMSAIGAGTAVLSIGLTGCSIFDDEVKIPVTFDHGVASGDPVSDSVILWTRVTPQQDVKEVTVSWEVATDDRFTKLIISGHTTTTSARDFTLKVDASGLSPETTYYFRFKSNGVYSTTGRTRTLPVGSVDRVKLAVISCSNYPAGYFNVLGEIAARNDLNAVLHLGDYIYEYSREGYASEKATEMDREVLPGHELYVLDDYRTRYAQYRSDEDMQAFHANLPMISVWDDHEIANDTWREGAENHSDNEGSFDQRKAAAIQAYFEWLPIRPFTEGDNETIYRSFHFGDLIDLHMLDTRLIGRDEQLNYADYFDKKDSRFNSEAFSADLTNSKRTMMGSEQLEWLKRELATDTGTWQLLGNQTLMGKMQLPIPVVAQKILPDDYAELTYVYQLYAKKKAGGKLNKQEQAYLHANRNKLTQENYALVTSPYIPYNLDAWDGYYHEREVIYAAARTNGSNLVVVSGDTHNAWANNLTDAHGNAVGVEFATASVSSPGMEQYLGATKKLEGGLVNMVECLQYTNLTDRGYLVVNFTTERVKAEWQFVSTVRNRDYCMLEDRFHALSVTAGVNKIA